MKKLLLLQLFLLESLSAISLDRLIALTFQNNPNLQAFDLKQHTFLLEASKESLWRDPVLGLGVNDILLTKPLQRDLEPMQTHSVSISQVIPLSNRLDLKSRLSQSDALMQTYRKESYKRVLRSKILAFSYRYLVLKRKLFFLNRLVTNLKKEKKVLSYLYESSKTSQTELLAIQRQIERTKLKRETLHYLQKETLLEIEKLSFVAVNDIEATLQKRSIVLDAERIVATHPSILLLQEKIKQAKDAIKLEEANKRADLKLSLGYFQRDGFEDYVSVNLSMPLKVTQKEKITIQQKRVELHRLTLQLKSAKHTLKKEIENLKVWMQKSAKNSQTIQQRLLSLNQKERNILKHRTQTTETNSLKLYQNQVQKIELELLRLDEMLLYFKAYAKSAYYKERL